MYKLLYNMWIMDKLNEENINKAVEKELITNEEAEEILETPKATKQ